MNRINKTILRPLAFVLLALPALAQDQLTKTGSLSQDPKETENSARELIDRGNHSEAIGILKGALERYPHRPAYLRDQNDFWALKTLADAVEADPRNCQYRLWMAWILLRQGAFDRAGQSLLSSNYASGGPDHTRAWILKTMIDRHSKPTSETRRQLFMVIQKASVAYPEDRQAMVSLAESLNPGRLPFLAGRIECNAGWTSNALTGSPSDPASSGESTSSPMALGSAWVRFMGPSVKSSDGLSRFRTSIEFQGKAAGYTRESGRDLSYLLTSVRPAILIGNLNPRALFGYRYENYLVSGGDRYEPRPLWFYEAHRGEFEFELPFHLTIFGGAGRRVYREIGRSRFEGDGGIGWGFSPMKNTQVLAAVSGRSHTADKAPYDLTGGTMLLSATQRLFSSLSIRTGISYSLDDYTRSAGYFDAVFPDTKRREQVAKLSLALQTSARVGHPQPGFLYEYSARSSTIDSFDYQDHRVFLKWTWSFSLETGLPGSVSPPEHVSLDYESSAKEAGDRIQDLLRQDETMQRGSTCLD